MRQRSHLKAPPQFAFWTRGEIVRLSVMAITCTIPVVMPAKHAHPLTLVARPAFPASASSSHVRAIRVTSFDVNTTGIAALGDSDATN